MFSTEDFDNPKMVELANLLMELYPNCFVDIQDGDFPLVILEGEVSKMEWISPFCEEESERYFGSIKFPFSPEGTPFAVFNSKENYA